MITTYILIFLGVGIAGPSIEIRANFATKEVCEQVKTILVKTRGVSSDQYICINGEVAKTS